MKLVFTKEINCSLKQTPDLRINAMKVSAYVPATKNFVERISGKVRDKFVLRESVILLFLKTLFKICQFGFIFLMARYLSQEDFGDFQFVAGTINLITQPAVVLTLVVARIGCSFPLEFQLENIRWFFQQWKALIIALSCAIVLLFVVGDGVLIEFSKIEAHGSFAVAGITIVASLVFYYYMGFLQALESFKAIGLLFFLTGSVTFILGIAVVLGDLGILTVYGTEATARMIALVVTLWLISKSLPKQSLPNRRIK